MWSAGRWERLERVRDRAGPYVTNAPSLVLLLRYDEFEFPAVVLSVVTFDFVPGFDAESVSILICGEAVAPEVLVVLLPGN